MSNVYRLMRRDWYGKRFHSKQTTLSLLLLLLLFFVLKFVLHCFCHIYNSIHMTIVNYSSCYYSTTIQGCADAILRRAWLRHYVATIQRLNFFFFFLQLSLKLFLFTNRNDYRA
jgi:hypothetical protein